MKKTTDNKMMFYSNYNSSNVMNGLSEWSQIVPICMPWAQTQPTQQSIETNNSNVNERQNGSVMQFTAHNNFDPTLDLLSPDPCTSQTATRWELLNNISTGSLSSNQHLKRRNDSSDEELEDGLKRPVKQYISEDKVSAIFNRMHITNNNAFEDTFECDQELDSSETESSYSPNHELSKTSQIVFTDEVQKAINAKAITDKLIQNEFDKLSKALVVWQPTNVIIPSLLTPKVSQDDKEEEQQNDSSNENSYKNSSNNNDYSDIETIDFTPIDEVIESDNEMELCP